MEYSYYFQLNLEGTGTTKFLGGDSFPMGGDGQTVLNLEGTGTTKFSAGLFQLNLEGTGTTKFLAGLFSDGW